MDFSIKQGHPEQLRTGCVVVGVQEDGKLGRAAQALDRAAKQAISTVIRRGDMTGKQASTLLLHGLPGMLAERVLLVGIGNPNELDNRSRMEILTATFKALQATAAEEAALCIIDDLGGKDAAWVLKQAVIAAAGATYRSDGLKSKPAKPPTLKRIIFITQDRPATTLKQTVAQASAIAQGMALTRDLGNLPANLCTPAYLAKQAQALARKYKTIKVTVLERKDMERLGMGALLAVTRGSAEAPKLITLKYTGTTKSKAPVALVGKGITFDTGGISLKPGADMDEMKYDMSGAGTVLGTLRAVAEMGLPVNVVGIIPTCENMPSGTATRPGDIVTSLSGQTIEILNTDAEGRLILCDALTYAARFKPDTVIDIATLTGACVIALGHVASGLFANDAALAAELIAAGEQSHDRVWQLPLWEDYQSLLDSNFADMANIGGRAAGTITAACFLARFAKDYRWAHLDIAGTAYRSGKEKGATGRPVPLLAQYLINRAMHDKG